MPGNVINCKKCNKVFQRRLADHCPDCVKQEEEQFAILYRALQKSASQGGMEVSVLAEQVGISAEKIEKMYLEGRLSTAGNYLKLPCQACSTLTREIERKGRYCIACSEQTANRAGVEVKSIQAIRQAEEDEKTRQERMEIIKKAPTGPVKDEPRHFGFSVR